MIHDDFVDSIFVAIYGVFETRRERAAGTLFFSVSRERNTLPLTGAWGGWVGESVLVSMKCVDTWVRVFVRGSMECAMRRGVGVRPRLVCVVVPVLVVYFVCT